jgi:hypothetical protein
MGSVSQGRMGRVNVASTVTPELCCERTSPVKNRKREIRTSGSVRGEDGNILTYSAMTVGSLGTGKVTL